MKKIIDRNYLEIKSLNDLIESSLPELNQSIDLEKINDFQVNKFFYKNVGKKHRWTDRLIWSEADWIKYVSDPKVQTYILKSENDLAGYFELILHYDSNEIEIAYFGLLEEYHNKKLGSYFLSCGIKEAFKEKISRLWLHTCTLDHKNALNNYLARGMKVFKEETIRV